jgi:hypothetical protein
MSATSVAWVRWRSVPSVLGPHDECRLAREAFAQVAPGGVLPEQPTPLQRMIYTRMVTSTFIAAMADRVALPPEREIAP